MSFLQSKISKKAGGISVTFAFTFRTLAILAQSTDMKKFDDLTGFEQIPLLLFAGLVAGNNPLPDDFGLEQMDDFIFTMDPEDVGEVYQHGSEALGFIGLAMKKLAETAETVQKAGKKEVVKIG